MALMTWSDDLSVDIKEIDGEHRFLVKLINQLYEAMSTGKSKEVLNDTLSGLGKYTVAHFGTEEKYFSQISYEGAIEHKVEHDRFVKKVVDFQSAFEKGTLSLSLELMQFLKDWLIKHIQGTDRKYIECFHAHGLR